MADREVGKAFVSLRADEASLRGDIAAIRARLTAATREISNGTQIKIRVDDTQVTQAIKRVSELHAALVAVGRLNTTITIRDNADTTRLRLSGLSDQLKAIPRDIDIRATVDSRTAVDDLQRVENKAVTVDRSDPNIHVTADTREASANLERVLGIVRNIAVGIGTGALIGAVVQASKQIGTFAVSSVAAFEQVQVSFEGLFRSKDVATSFLGDLQDFAAKTPFQFDTLTGSAQRLLGTFGRGFKDELIPTLTAVGDVAASLGQAPAAVDRVILAISQIQGKGKVQLEELNQIREALPGFNAVAAIADGLGISVQEATGKISKGSVSATDAIAALITGMREFPGAAGAMERQSATLNGRISTLKDNMLILARGAFTPLASSVGVVVDALASSVKIGGQFTASFDMVGEALTKIVDNNAPGFLKFIVQLGDGFGRVLTALEPILTASLPLLAGLIEPLVVVIEQLAVVATEVVEVVGPPLITVFQVLGDVIGAIPVDVLQGLVDVFIALKVGTLASAAIVAVTGSMTGLAALAGPIGILAAAAAALFLVFSDDGPTEQEKELGRAVGTVAVELEKQLTGLTTNSEALKQITEDGNAAAAAQIALSNALAGVRAVEVTGPDPLDTSGRIKDILGALTGDTFTPSIAGGAGALGSVDEALTALGVTADKTFLLLQRVRAANKSGGELDVTGLFPTKEQGRDAQIAYKAARDGQENVFNGSKELLRQLEAFNTLTITGATSDTVFKSLESDIRSSLEALALVDPVARDVLARGDKLREGLGNPFGDTQADLEAFMVEYAEAIAAIEQNPPTADFTALITDLGQITTPIERAELALKGVNEQLAILNGTKINVREAQAAFEALIDSFSVVDEDGNLVSFFTQVDSFGGGKTITLDLEVQAGRDNAAKLSSALATIKALADAQFADTGNPLVAEVYFNANINKLRDEFVAEGGSLDQFNTALNSGAYGPNEIQYKAVLEAQTVVGLQAEITNKIAKSAPKIAIALQADLDAGNIAKVQAKIDFLTQLNEGGYIVDFDPNVDEEAADAAAQELALLSATQDVGISPEMDRAAKAQYIKELEEITGDKYVTIRARTSGFAGLYDAILSHTPQESGGIWKAGRGMMYEAGGFSNIREVAPHMITAAAATKGPYYMYGEPSTHGEAFISMAPKWRDRSEKIWTDVGEQLGFMHPAVATVSQGGGDMAGVAARLDRLIGRVNGLASAMMLMPPITVVAAGGSPDNAAAKIWYANKARVVDVVGADV